MTTQKSHMLKSRGAIALFILSIALLAGIVTAPLALRHMATSWLLNHGMTEAHIENIDLNPFVGKLAIHGVETMAQSGERSSLDGITVNVAMTALLKKRIHIQSLHATGINLVVDNSEGLTLGGLVLPKADPTSEVTPKPPQKTPASRWLMGIDSVSIVQSTLAISLKNIATRLDLEEFTLTTLLAWAPEHEARLEVKGTLDRSPLLISLDVTPFAAIQGGQGGIQLQAFDLNRLNRMAEPRISALRGELTLDTQVALSHSQEEGTTLSQTGTLSVVGLGGTIPSMDMDLTALDLAWLGDLWMALSPQGDLQDLRSLGRLANTKLNTSLAPQNLRIRHKGLVWDGELRLQPLIEDGLSARGNISLASASVTDTQSGAEIMGISNLFAYDIKARGEDIIRTPHIALKGLTALTPMARIGQLDLTGVALRNLHQLRAESVIIKGMATVLDRDASGTFPALDRCTALLAARPEKKPGGEANAIHPTPEDQKNHPFALKINTFRVKGDELFTFSDASVSPAFNKSLNLKFFELQGIDSSKPQKAIPLTLQAELSPYETIDVQGTIRPFQPTLTAHLDVRVSNINLVPLSPYSAQTLGYLIKSGTFATQTTLDVNKGILDIANDVTLHHVQLIPMDKAKVDQVMKTLTMPLDMALSVLENKHNTIRLSIPIRGDMQNPEISLQHIINKAITKAITLTSISYLQFLLQPYGTFLYMAEIAGEYATRIRLDPVVFDLGETLPNQASLDYLKVVANLMNKKKALNLTVCASAVLEDLPTKKEGAEVPMDMDPTPYLNLTRQRAKAVREALLTDGVAPSRIILCQPRSAISKLTEPKALLTL